MYLPHWRALSLARLTVLPSMLMEGKANNISVQEHLCLYLVGEIETITHVLLILYGLVHRLNNTCPGRCCLEGFLKSFYRFWAFKLADIRQTDMLFK